MNSSPRHPAASVSAPVSPAGSLEDLRTARHAMQINSAWRQTRPGIGDTAGQCLWDLLAVVDRLLGEETNATRYADALTANRTA